jgi:HSP20 family protein
MRFSPSTELEKFPVGLRMFRDSVSRLFGEPSNRPWSPAVNITEHELVLKADVPEIEMKDIDLQVENGTVTLKGERKFEQGQNGRGYHRIERGYGSFVRAFTLPDSVDVDKVKAQYSGVLTVTLSKKEAAKPEIIRVEINNN